MFPKSRGPVRRAPEPTDKEILGPLAPFAVEGLMSLPFFGGKGKQSPAEYLESIGATPDQIADPSKLDEIDRAKYDAYRIYGPETERDTFGWDELAHMAGAVWQLPQPAAGHATRAELAASQPHALVAACPALATRVGRLTGRSFLSGVRKPVQSAAG